jgi:predicted Zn-dependent protease
MIHAAPTRRALLSGVACAGLLSLLPTRLRAGPDTAMQIHGRLLKTLSMDVQEQARFGQELERSLFMRAGGPYANPFAQAAIADFCRPLFAAASSVDLPWNATIIDNDMPAAWVLPGGRIAIHAGLLRYLDAADELAAAIAHCMGHAESGHLVEVMREPAFARAILAPQAAAILAHLAEEPEAAVTDPVIARALELPVFQAVRTGYGTIREAAADSAIIRILARTGHDPARGAALFETIDGLVPPDATATSCLFGGRAALAIRLRTLRQGARTAPRNWPSNPGFETLKAAFPTRRHYRPLPVVETPS